MVGEGGVGVCVERGWAKGLGTEEAFLGLWRRTPRRVTHNLPRLADF